MAQFLPSNDLPPALAKKLQKSQNNTPLERRGLFIESVKSLERLSAFWAGQSQFQVKIPSWVLVPEAEPQLCTSAKVVVSPHGFEFLPQNRATSSDAASSGILFKFRKYVALRHFARNPKQIFGSRKITQNCLWELRIYA
jgi:hypothetical protein